MERPLRGLAVISPPPARSRPEAAKGEKPVPGCGGLGRPPVAALPPGSGKTLGTARAQRAPPRTSHWSRAAHPRSPIRRPYRRLPSAEPALGGLTGRLYITAIMQTWHGFLSQPPCSGCARRPLKGGSPLARSASLLRRQRPSWTRSQRPGCSRFAAFAAERRDRPEHDPPAHALERLPLAWDATPCAQTPGRALQSATIDE